MYCRVVSTAVLGSSFVDIGEMYRCHAFFFFFSSKWTWRGFLITGAQVARISPLLTNRNSICRSSFVVVGTVVVVFNISTSF